MVNKQKLINNYLIIFSIFFLIIFSLYLIQPIIIPCLTSAIIAYLLEPLVKKFEKFGLSRAISVSIIILFFISMLLLSMIIIIPLILSQLSAMGKFLIDKASVQNKAALIDSLPTYLHKKELLTLFKNFSKNILNLDSIESLHQISNSVFTILGNLTNSIINSSLNISTSAISLFMIPLLFFYMSCSWTKITNTLYKSIPLRYKNTFTIYINKIGNIVSAYIRGQISVCLIMAISYTIGLSIIGINYSFAIGIISGFMTFIPYVGPLICMILSIIIAAFQFGSWITCSFIILLFIIGHLIESNIITPLLIGKEVDLHPIWIIIGMVVCASKIGFFGILLSIPITAIIGVLVRSTFSYYLSSSFYQNK